MKVAIGNDHSAVEINYWLEQYLSSLGHQVVNLGTKQQDSVDYPFFGKDVGNKVANKEVEKGIIICGTGVGISLAANKIKGVRAMVCKTRVEVIMAKKFFDLNVLSLSSRTQNIGNMQILIDEFLK